MTAPQKGRIFISYRRADSAGYAGRIYDRLTAHFGEDAVFMDVDTIEAGIDFVEVLQNAVQSCDVLVALIGRRWLDSKDADGKRRLDNPEDFVRVEIAAALERDIRVIPVLVDGVTIPRSTELPENLKPLARRNALQVNHHSFNADARRLISQLELALKAAEDSRILKAQQLQEEKERKEKKAAAKAAHEKEERERREAEEKVREKADAEKRARLAAEQKAKKEREEWEQKEAEEKARKAAQRKERLDEAVERIQNIFRSGNKLPFYIGGGVVILFVLGYIIRNALVPSAPSMPTEITVDNIVTLGTSTPTSTEIPTEIPEELGVGSTMISEKDGIVMVYVPAGEFQMGIDVDEALLAECRKLDSDCERDWFADEEPIHTVYLDAFWIDQTEVTNNMYAAFLNSEGNESESGIIWLDVEGSYVRIQKVEDTWQADSYYEDHPVTYVSWFGAKAYCEWADRRLPTEAEWEKAATWDEKKQIKFVYPWGDSIDCSQANYGSKDCVGDTTAVGSYKNGQSSYGAYDMAGNVWEWVADWSDSRYYHSSPVSNPIGPSSGEYRVLRGGSLFDLAINVRSTARYGHVPAHTYVDIGFRCARDATP